MTGRGWTQEQLARKAGIRQATVSDLETGRDRRIGLDIVDKLARALGVEPGELFERAPRHPRPGREPRAGGA